MKTINQGNDDDVKIYHYQKQQDCQAYRNSLAVEKRQRIEAMAETLKEKVPQLRTILRTLKEKEIALSSKDNLIVEMAEELMEKSERTLGDEFQRLPQLEDEQIESFHRMFCGILEVLASEKEKSFDEKVN